ncbi:hypothetical protein C7444_103323 [Sphaerotilus hippei]|uniref:Iron uptake protein n=1 Tax=Sphaerotilus hippei TaxID=744406 RepID=A0A318H3Y9_9BURK|nr:iron uptake protein [Sphaerotilus hippei]PXW98225.1 hypothetical protein C7444_103323 [Sphaerotilus hippei]
MKDKSIRGPDIAARVLAGIFGSYAFTWGFSAAGVTALVGLGVEYHDAEMGMLMLAFLMFPGLLLWCFAVRRIGWAWMGLGSGTLLLCGTAWAIQRTLLA